MYIYVYFDAKRKRKKRTKKGERKKVQIKYTPKKKLNKKLDFLDGIDDRAHGQLGSGTILVFLQK